MGLLFTARLWKKDFGRDGINVLEIPLTKLCARIYEPRQRLLFKNLGYVGLMASILEMDKRSMFPLLRTIQGKRKTYEPNVKALNIGLTAEENFKDFGNKSK